MDRGLKLSLRCSNDPLSPANAFLGTLGFQTSVNEEGRFSNLSCTSHYKEPEEIINVAHGVRRKWKKQRGKHKTVKGKMLLLTTPQRLLSTLYGISNYDAAQESGSSEPALALEQPLRRSHTRQDSELSITVTIAPTSVLLLLSAFIAITSTAAVTTNFKLTFFGVSVS